MRPICLVLLAVTSVLAAPSVVVHQVSENEVARPVDNGRPVSSYVTGSSYYFIDGGDTNISILNLEEILNDLANHPNAVARSIAIGQTLGLLINMATGIPGDACAAAALNNAYGNAVHSGNYAGVRAALNHFIGQFAGNLGLVQQLALNPNSVKYSVGPTEGCSGGGRAYNFEGAWDGILDLDSDYYSLMREEYCVAKRLYYAFNSRSNNAGATATALALPPVVRILEGARLPAAAFLRNLIAGRDATADLVITQQRLLEGLNNVKL